jgi:hypothetical protein
VDVVQGQPLLDSSFEDIHVCTALVQLTLILKHVRDLVDVALQLEGLHNLPCPSPRAWHSALTVANPRLRPPAGIAINNHVPVPGELINALLERCGLTTMLAKAWEPPAKAVSTVTAVEQDSARWLS